MLRFRVYYNIRGKDKDTFVRALISVIRLGLNHDVVIDDNDGWSLETDIIFRKDLPSHKVPQYLKLLKHFINGSNNI